MLKKIIAILAVLCLVFSVCVMAEKEIPQTRPGGMGMPPMGEMPQGDINKGQMPPDFPNNGGVAPSENNKAVENSAAPKSIEENEKTQNGNFPFGGQMPEGFEGFPGNMSNFNQQASEVTPGGFLGFVKTYSTPLVSVILLGFAFIFVIFYKRKNY